ncbi:MAG: hypothetical protein IK152_07225 [Lachnospiraceae bacterium]|nr:hypothetical protein [Lachnospiraceae bacterium]
MDEMEKIVITDEKRKLLGSLTILSESDDDLPILTSYVEITRHLGEIYQWYGIFNYNTTVIKSLFPDGDLYAINSHTIMLLSAGKTIIDEIEHCLENSFCNDHKQVDDFLNNHIRKEYDGNYSYRLLYRLRNFCQHGHIPVSRHHQYPCFDLSQIYYTPYYSFNKTLQKESQKLIDDVAQITGNNLSLSYIFTVSSYLCSIYRIYKSFLKTIHPILCKKTDDVKWLINRRPQLIHHKGHPELDGFIFYEISASDKNLHSFSTQDDPTIEHTRQLNDCTDQLKEEASFYKRMHTNWTPI